MTNDKQNRDWDLRARRSFLQLQLSVHIDKHFLSDAGLVRSGIIT